MTVGQCKSEQSIDPLPQWVWLCCHELWHHILMVANIAPPRACARGKAIPSARRLSVCLSVCLSSAKKNVQISYKQILLQLIIVS